MQTTKLVFMFTTCLAMIAFSIGQPFNAEASAKAPKPSHSSTKQHTAAVGSTSVNSAKSMQGVAAVYSDKLNGRKTSSGQRFSQKDMTAAHRSLPLGTKVRVTNLRNSKSVEVSINDRGPRHRSRVIDLSAAAAAQLGMNKRGNALVKLEVITETAAGNS